MKNETCCICDRRPGKIAVPKQAEFMGRKIPVMALICDKCAKDPAVDKLLDAYVERIFGNTTVH